MIARSIFIKFVGPNKNFYIEERRVWEPELFLNALARFEGGDGYSAVVTTWAHYKEWKNGKRQ